MLLSSCYSLFYAPPLNFTAMAWYRPQNAAVLLQKGQSWDHRLKRQICDVCVSTATLLIEGQHIKF